MAPNWIWMSTYRALVRFIGPFKWALIFAVVLTGGLTLVGMVQPLLMRTLINDVAGEQNWGIFPLIMGLLFGVPVLRAMINIANLLVLRKVGLGIIARTRKQLFRKLLTLSMKYHNDTPTGAINQRIMGDVGAISGLVTGGMITLFTDAISVCFAVVVMFGLSPKLSILTIALLPLYYLNFKLFSSRIRSNSAALRTHMDYISSSFQEQLSAHEIIQSFNVGANKENYFTTRARDIMDSAIRGSVLIQHLPLGIGNLVRSQRFSEDPGSALSRPGPLLPIAGNHHVKSVLRTGHGHVEGGKLIPEL